VQNDERKTLMLKFEREREWEWGKLKGESFLNLWALELGLLYLMSKINKGPVTIFLSESGITG